MRVMFWAAVVAYAAVLGVLVAELPDRVPLHFGPGGEPDRWGSRHEALTAFAVLGVVMTVLFAGMSALHRRLPLDSAMVKLPHKSWWAATPAREERARRMLTADGLALGAVTLVFLAATMLLVLRAARAATPALGAAFWMALGAYLAVVLGWSVWTMMGRYRPEEER